VPRRLDDAGSRVAKKRITFACGRARSAKFRAALSADHGEVVAAAVPNVMPATSDDPEANAGRTVEDQPTAGCTPGDPSGKKSSIPTQAIFQDHRPGFLKRTCTSARAFTVYTPRDPRQIAGPRRERLCGWDLRGGGLNRRTDGAKLGGQSAGAFLVDAARLRRAPTEEHGVIAYNP